MRKLAKPRQHGLRVFGPSAPGHKRPLTGLLASLAYPLLSKEHLRTGCDLMNLFFIVDEWTDVSNEAQSRSMVSIILDALQSPHRPRPNNEWVGGEIARQFWQLATQSMSTPAQQRFLTTFEEYLNAVVDEAKDRSHHRIRDVRSYLKLRRNTIGAKPSFAILEAGMELPEEVLNHPVLVELTNLTIDLLCIGNDLVSYNKEQASGDDEHNIITIIMANQHTTVTGALSWVADYHAKLEARFNEVYRKIPRWGGALDIDVQTYAFGLGNWVRANDQWSFESERYFGTRGLEIMESRTVAILPKVNPGVGAAEVGPVVVDESLL
ncbi:terpene cyclase, variant 3 [Coniochaeta pulveracea]|uniref:Terpene synthase n=1 Tax=Coniochaeta pulveracea TaxID=177199 RepID=A0A420YL29_9PEZI|nr:terpene cyclase, variant 3 [Coniochaeta pulveracea]